MARRFDVRKELFRMVAFVLVLHAAAIGGYRYYTSVRGVTQTAKLTFTVIWMLVTLAIVLTSLRRIRLGRLGGPGRPGGRSPRAR